MQVKTIANYMSLRRYYAQSRNPRGIWGFHIVKVMNGKRHAALPDWVFSEVEIKEDAHVLDVGCGGGANVARLLARCPEGHVTGLDNSSLCLEEAKDLNYPAIVDKKCLIVGGNVSQLPLAKDMFDVVTAFETIYFWPSLEIGFEEVLRVLKPGGTFVVANELDGLDPEYRKIETAVGMLIYSIEEITDKLTSKGFTNIQARHDEKRHFICVTATKP